jgi:aldose 1-epimerase
VNGWELLVDPDPHPMRWGAFPMVPFAGRIREGRFRFGDITVKLPANLGPHAIHGTGFDHPWAQEADGSLTVELSWPFGGWARQRFAAAAGMLNCTIEVGNDHRAMPAQAGWHPWFRKPVTLGFTAAAMYRRDDAGIPTGDLVAPPPGPWDDCFTGVTQPVRLTWADGPVVEVSSTCDHWVVYDQPVHATCVEPQTGPPDAFNLGHGFTVVEPGAPLVATMTYRVVPATDPPWAVVAAGR